MGRIQSDKSKPQAGLGASEIQESAKLEQIYKWASKFEEHAMFKGDESRQRQTEPQAELGASEIE